jgi:hypothetical protein
MRKEKFFNSWIARRRSASRAKSQAAGACRSRALRFEACEPRIALSTTAVDELWVRVSRPDEGGWISAGDSISGAGVTVAVLDSGFSGFEANESRAYFSGTSRYGLTSVNVTPGLGSNGLASDSVFVPRLLGTSGDMATSIASLRWQIVNGSFNNDYLLFDSDAFGVPEITVNSWSFHANQFVGIAPPTGKLGGSEGGQISMAAFSGLEGLSLSQPGDSAMLAKRGPVGPPANVEPELAPANSAPVETLRGRAVVYEVAQASGERAEALRRDPLDTIDASMANYDAAGMLELRPASLEATPLPEAGRANRIGVTPASYFSDDAGRAGQRTSRQLDAVRLVLDSKTLPLPPVVHDGDEGQVADIAAFESQEATNAGESDAATARDAAFALFERQSQAAAEERATLAIPTDARQRRMLGAAVVLAVSAGPAYKWWRRRTAPLIEQPRLRKFRQASPLPT